MLYNIIDTCVHVEMSLKLLYKDDVVYAQVKTRLYNGRNRHT